MAGFALAGAITPGPVNLIALRHGIRTALRVDGRTLEAYSIRHVSASNATIAEDTEPLPAVDGETYGPVTLRL